MLPCSGKYYRPVCLADAPYGLLLWKLLTVYFYRMAKGVRQDAPDLIAKLAEKHPSRCGIPPYQIMLTLNWRIF